MTQPSLQIGSPSASALSERDILLTLFDLGRQVASVIEFDELLHKIPELIGRLIPFDAFAVYLLDERRNELSIGYAVGYPDSAGFKLQISEGIVGRVVATQQALVAGRRQHGSALHRSGPGHGVDALPCRSSTRPSRLAR